MKIANQSRSLRDPTFATFLLPWPWPWPDDHIRTWPDISRGDIP